MAHSRLILNAVRGRYVYRRALLGLMLALALVVPALAQTGQAVIDDPDHLLGDGSAVRSAAQQLVAKGPDVVVIAAHDAGSTADDAQSYLDNRLKTLGLAENSRTLRGNQIVFYVAPKPGFDGIYFVARYKDKLQPVYQRIQADSMRPSYTRGDL